MTGHTTTAWWRRVLASGRRLIGRLVREVNDDGALDAAASVAFWLLLSLPATLLAGLASLSLIDEDLTDELRELTNEFVDRVFTGEADELRRTVDSLFEQNNAGLFSISLVLALVTMSRGFAGLIRALDVVYDVEESRGFLRVRVAAFGMGIGTLATVALSTYLWSISESAGVPSLVRIAVALAILVVWAATVFHIGPNHHTPWRYDLPGALLAAIGWLVLSVGYGWYIELAAGGGNQAVGLVGALLLGMTWVWFVCLVLLIGGELNEILAESSRGDRREHLDDCPAAFAPPRRPLEPSGVDDALEERLRAWLGGRLEDARRRALLEDSPLMQEAHAVADLAGERHLVRRDQHRHPVGLQPANDVEHLADEFGIEGRRDLVEQHHLGVHGQRPGDGDALLLAAGELVGIRIGAGSETESGQHLQRVGACLALRDLQHLARTDGDVVGDRHVREQIEALEHHADAASDRVRVEAGLGDVDTVEQHLAVVDRFEHVDAAQERRLARPGGADQRDHVALGDVEIDAVEHGGVVERLEHIAELELQHGVACRRDGRFGTARRVRHAIVVAPVRRRCRASA